MIMKLQEKSVVVGGSGPLKSDHAWFAPNANKSKLYNRQASRYSGEKEFDSEPPETDSIESTANGYIMNTMSQNAGKEQVMSIRPCLAVGSQLGGWD